MKSKIVTEHTRSDNLSILHNFLTIQSLFLLCTYHYTLTLSLSQRNRDIPQRLWFLPCQVLQAHAAISTLNHHIISSHYRTAVCCTEPGIIDCNSRPDSRKSPSKQQQDTAAKPANNTRDIDGPPEKHPNTTHFRKTTELGHETLVTTAPATTAALMRLMSIVILLDSHPKQ